MVFSLCFPLFLKVRLGLSTTTFEQLISSWIFSFFIYQSCLDCSTFHDFTQGEKNFYKNEGHGKTEIKLQVGKKGFILSQNFVR